MLYVESIKTGKEYIPCQVSRRFLPMLLIGPSEMCSRLEGLEHVIPHVLTEVRMILAARRGALLPQVFHSVLTCPPVNGI
jgi:hypothetical protein